MFLSRYSAKIIFPISVEVSVPWPIIKEDSLSSAVASLTKLPELIENFPGTDKLVL